MTRLLVFVFLGLIPLVCFAKAPVKTTSAGATKKIVSKKNVASKKGKKKLTRAQIRRALQGRQAGFAKPGEDLSHLLDPDEEIPVKPIIVYEPEPVATPRPSASMVSAPRPAALPSVKTFMKREQLFPKLVAAEKAAEEEKRRVAEEKRLAELKRKEEEAAAKAQVEQVAKLSGFQKAQEIAKLEGVAKEMAIATLSEKEKDRFSDIYNAPADSIVAINAPDPVNNFQTFAQAEPEWVPSYEGEEPPLKWFKLKKVSNKPYLVDEDIEHEMAQEAEEEIDGNWAEVAEGIKQDTPEFELEPASALAENSTPTEKPLPFTPSDLPAKDAEPVLEKIAEMKIESINVPREMHVEPPHIEENENENEYVVEDDGGSNAPMLSALPFAKPKLGFNTESALKNRRSIRPAYEPEQEPERSVAAIDVPKGKKAVAKPVRTKRATAKRVAKKPRKSREIRQVASVSPEAESEDTESAEGAPAPLQGAEVAIVLNNNRFFPARIRLRDGQPTRLVFTTLNKKPAALVIESLNVQRWLGREPAFAKNPWEQARYEINREVSKSKVTEVMLEPKRGRYPFHDALTGAMGEIIVE